jgi:ATP-dependent transcriptional regulator
MIEPNKSLSVPSKARNIIERQRLMLLGQNLLKYQITTVIAPAGYGKTVWISSLLNNPGWPATVWYSIEQQDLEPYNFLFNLILAIKKTYPDFGQDSLRTLKGMENFDRNWSTGVKAILTELPSDRQIMLIFDDLHYIYNNKQTIIIFEYLLQRLPENFHTVLISRNDPPFKLYYHELTGELLQIRQQELLFTKEEALSLFSIMGLQLTAVDAASLFNLSKGWAVGLRLLGLYLNQTERDLDNVLQLMNKENSSFHKYLGNEILDKLPQHLMDFFLGTSVLPYLEEGLCNAAFQMHESHNLLETLYSYGLLSPLEEEQSFWQIHPLMSDWLQSLANKKFSPNDIAAIRNRTSDYLEQKGDIIRAIEQVIIAKNWKRTALLIHQYGYDYFSSFSHHDILYSWIEALPQEIKKADYWLQYFIGTSIIHVDNERAFQVFSDAADLASQKNDIKCEACCILAMMISAVYGSNLQFSQSAAARLENNPSLLNNPLSRGEALTTALCYSIIKEEYWEGIKLSQQALGLKVNPELHIYILHFSSFIHARLGNIVQARELIEKALSMTTDQKNDRYMALVYQMTCTVFFTFGDLPAMLKSIQKCFEIGLKYNLFGLLAPISFFKAKILLQEGHEIESLQMFDLTTQYAAAGGFEIYHKSVELEILLIKISNGENARIIIPQALELLTWFREKPACLGLDSLMQFAVGIIAMEAGELEMAKKMLEECSQHYAKVGAKQDLAMANLLQAHLLLLEGKERTADSLLHSVLGAAEAGHWISFGWGWHAKTIYTMCRRALQKHIYAPWAARFLIRWFPERSRQELGFLLVSDNTETSSFAQNYFHNLWQETGLVIIHVFFLGKFRLFINGSEVEETKWITQKAENLFKFLAVKQKQYPKENIVDILWPDSDLDSSEGKLRMTLSYLRKSLSSEKMPVDWVILRRGQISLDPRIEVYNDIELFTQEADIALQYYETNHPYTLLAMEQAIRFYQGEFLPDDCYEDWTDSYRFHFHNLYLELLEKTAQTQYRNGNFTEAWQTCNKYLASEPLDETLLRLGMKILCLLGKKAKAIALYRSMATTLDKDYATTPEPETSKLFDDISKNHIAF